MKFRPISLFLVLVTTMNFSSCKTNPEKKEEEEEKPTKGQLAVPSYEVCLSKDKTKAILVINKSNCNLWYSKTKTSNYDDMKLDYYSEIKEYETYSKTGLVDPTYPKKQGVEFNFGEVVSVYAQKEEYTNSKIENIQIPFGKLPNPTAKYEGFIGKKGEEYKATNYVISFNCEENSNIFYIRDYIASGIQKTVTYIKKNGNLYSPKEIQTIKDVKANGVSIGSTDDIYFCATKENYFDSDLIALDNTNFPKKIIRPSTYNAFQNVTKTYDTSKNKRGGTITFPIPDKTQYFTYYAYPENNKSVPEFSKFIKVEEGKQSLNITSNGAKHYFYIFHKSADDNTNFIDSEGGIISASFVETGARSQNPFDNFDIDINYENSFDPNFSI